MRKLSYEKKVKANRDSSKKVVICSIVLMSINEREREKKDVKKERKKEMKKMFNYYREL
jgi:hypothetical protein